MPQHNSYDVYYKIMIPKAGRRSNEFFEIIAVQDFDEYDYSYDDWLQDDDGVVSFNSEEEAREYLNNHVDSKWVKYIDQTPKTHGNNWRSA